MLIDGFNKVFKNMAASYLKSGNESTSSILFWNTEKEYLPHLYYIYLSQNHWGKS